jgi:hypothetical protein
MASESTIGGSGTLFVGEDKTIRFALPSADDPLVGIDMTGWTMLLDIRLKDNSAEPAILSKTPTLTGVFNPVQALNTQRAVVTLTDTEMNLFKAKTYRWSWKRMDDGNETVLGYGNFTPQKATAP